MPVNENFVPKIQVFEPHRASLPPLGPYLKEFWTRRVFATELARFSDKAEYLDSRLGKVWLVLNPLLLGLIYYLVVEIIRPGGGLPGLTRLDHLLIGLFTFYFAQNCVTAGAQSITLGGRLILNQAFPRALLPLSCAIQAFQQFLWTSDDCTIAARRAAASSRRLRSVISRTEAIRYSRSSVTLRTLTSMG